MVTCVTTMGTGLDGAKFVAGGGGGAGGGGLGDAKGLGERKVRTSCIHSLAQGSLDFTPKHSTETSKTHNASFTTITDVFSLFM